MSLSVHSRVENDIAILDLEGTLTLGPALHQVRDAIREILGKKRISGIVLDLSSVTSADSAGLGELTVVYSLAGKKGASVAIAGASLLVRNMLEVTRLDGLLPVASDVSSAIALVSHQRRV